ncbi:MAG: hypothetical protein NT172_20855 [Planctomycetota bacterium]|nr:hypothetical protein [Planctomycetota bacterium]
MSSINFGVGSSGTYRFFWRVLPIAAFTVFKLAGLFALNSTFGSVPLAIRYLRGERLVLEPTNIRLGRPATVAA